MAIKAGTVFFEFKGNTAHLRHALNNIKISIGNIESLFHKLELVGVAAFAGIAVASRKAFKSAADFDAAMRRLAVITGASSREMKKLEDDALKFAMASGRSAKEITDGYLRIAQAGFESADTIKAVTKASLELSIAGQISAEESADLLTGLLRGWNMTVPQMERAGDTLTSVFMRTKADIHGLVESFKFLGPVARQMGMTFEEMAVVSGVMNDNLIRAGLVGRQLRTALISAFAPTVQSIKILKQYDIALEDAYGKQKSFIDLAAELKKKVSTAEFAKIFTRLSMSAAFIMGESGERIRELLAGLSEDAGKMTELTEAHLSSLQGKWERLTSTIDAAGIAIARSHNKPLGELIDKAKEWALTIKNLILDHTEFIISALTTAGAILLVGKALGLTIGIISAATPLLGILADGLILAFKNPRLLISIGIIAAAIATIGVAIWGVVEGIKWLAEHSDDIANAFKKMRSFLVSGVRGGAGKQLKDPTLVPISNVTEIKDAEAIALSKSLDARLAAERAAAAKKEADEAESIWIKAYKRLGEFGKGTLREFAPGMLKELEEYANQAFEVWKKAREKARKEAAAADATLKRKKKKEEREPFTIRPQEPSKKAIPIGISRDMENQIRNVGFTIEQVEELGFEFITLTSNARKFAEKLLGVTISFETVKFAVESVKTGTEIFADALAAKGIPLSFKQLATQVLTQTELFNRLGEVVQSTIGVLSRLIDSVFGFTKKIPTPAIGAAAGAAGGAYLGSTILPGWGTAIGAAVGGIAGIFGGMAIDSKKAMEAERAAREEVTKALEAEEAHRRRISELNAARYQKSQSDVAAIVTKFVQLAFNPSLLARAGTYSDISGALEESYSFFERVLQLGADQMEPVIAQLRERLENLNLAIALGTEPLGLTAEEMLAEVEAIGNALGRLGVALNEFVLTFKPISETIAKIVNKALESFANMGKKTVSPIESLFSNLFPGGKDGPIKSPVLGLPSGGKELPIKPPLTTPKTGPFVLPVKTGPLVTPDYLLDVEKGLAALLSTGNREVMEAAQSQLQAASADAAAALALEQAGIDVSSLTVAELQAVVDGTALWLDKFGDALAEAAEFIRASGQDFADKFLDEAMNKLFDPAEDYRGQRRLMAQLDVQALYRAGNEAERAALIQSLQQEMEEALQKQRLVQAGFVLPTGESLASLNAAIDTLNSIFQVLGVSAEAAAEKLDAVSEAINIPAGYKIDLARFRSIIGEASIPAP